MKKYRNIYLLVIGIIIWFTIWANLDLGKYFFTTPVKICNNTDLDINTLKLNNDYNYFDIIAWKCSNIKKIKNMSNKVSMEIYVHSDWKILSFQTNPTDLIWNSKIIGDEIIISVNSLNQWEKIIYEYIDAIEFDIK